MVDWQLGLVYLRWLAKAASKIIELEEKNTVDHTKLRQVLHLQRVTRNCEQRVHCPWRMSLLSVYVVNESMLAVDLEVWGAESTTYIRFDSVLLP